MIHQEKWALSCIKYKNWKLEANVRHDEVKERYDQTFQPEKDYKSFSKRKSCQLVEQKSSFRPYGPYPLG